MSAFKIITVLFSISFLVFSCKKDTPYFGEFDKKTMLKNLAEEIYLKNYNNFNQQIQLLKTSCTNFTNTPNQVNLKNLQNNWKTAVLNWQLCRAGNQGDIEENYLHNKIETRPHNALFIENNINSSDIISSNYLDTKGSSSKGFGAIEYLIFDAQNNNQVVLDSFILGINHTRRKEYLEACVDNNIEKAILLEQEWTDYKPVYISKTSNDIEGSTSKALNRLVSIIENLYVKKTGKPIGLNDDQLPHPELVEAPLSKTSLDLIKQDLIISYNMFFIPDNENLLSMNDYIDFLGVKYGDIKLTEAIKNKYNEIIQIIDNLPSLSLHDLVTANYHQISNLNQKLNELLILFKLDVASSMQITILLNDTDGD